MRPRSIAAAAPGHRIVYASNASRPCSQTEVGGRIGTARLPPPPGVTRSRVAARLAAADHRLPPTRDVGRERAGAVVEPPRRRIARTAVSRSGWAASVRCVGSGLPPRPSSRTLGSPVTKQRPDVRFVSRKR